MSEFLSKGKSLVAQGDRKLLSLGWFSNKYEEAADLFERGANQLKLAKACKAPTRCTDALNPFPHPAHPPPFLIHPAGKEAAETYIKLAECSIKLESKHDAASAWVEAAKAYQKCDGKSK
jgi:alpha-soluble NSF attachment protein